jgi:hypothetical protein
MRCQNFYLKLFCGCLLPVALLVFSCGGGKQPLQLHLVDKTTIDEQDLVMRYFPRQLTWLNDSEAAALVQNQVVLFNVYSGKIVRKFKSIALNTDSLVLATHARFWPSYQVLVPLEERVRNDPNMQSRVMSFAYNDGKFVMYYYVTCEHKCTSVKAAAEALARQQGDTPENIKIMLRDSNLLSRVIDVDFMSFMLVADQEFNVESIIPIYAEQFPKTHFAPILENGFSMRGNQIYCMAVNQESMFYQMDTLLVTDHDSLTLLGQLTLQKDTIFWTKESLNTLQIKGYSSSGLDYIRTDKVLRNVVDTLLVQTAYGICDVTHQKRWYIQPVLHDSEIVSGSFEVFPEGLAYTVSRHSTSMFDTKPNWTRLRLSDNSGNICSDTLMKCSPTFSRRNDTLLLITRDSSNYYFERYAVY